MVSEKKLRYRNQFLNKLAFLLLLFLLFLTGGCWDTKELANLAIVSGMGIDLDEKQPGNVIVTIQVIKPGEVKGASGGGDSGGGGGGTQEAAPMKAFIMLSSSGKTISEAIRNFVSILDREIYLSQNQIVVFGKEAAEQGLRPFLDYFIRTRQLRETTWILVSDGKANQILETNTGLEKIPAMEIDRLIINSHMASQASSATIHEFSSRLFNKALADYTSFIQLREDSGKKKLRLIGTAVFKEDKLVGEFGKIETRGLLWVINKVKRGVITVKSPGGGKIDLGINGAKCKMVPEIRNGVVNIKLDINAECGVIDTTIPEDFTSHDSSYKIENLLSRAIQREVKVALNKAFQLDADVFGFGEAIHRKYPKEWKVIKSSWDQIFLSANIRIKVKAIIKTVGLNVKPVLPK